MTQVVAEAEVPTTAYQYAGNLDYSTNYFWRVKAIEPFPSDWSATFCFQSEIAPEPTPQLQVSDSPLFWAWLIIAIGVALNISLLILIIHRRQV